MLMHLMALRCMKYSRTTIIVRRRNQDLVVCEKSWDQKVPLELLLRILAQSCVTPPYIFRQRVMHDCANILDSNAKGNSCSHNLSHTESLHHNSFN